MDRAGHGEISKLSSGLSVGMNIFVMATTVSSRSYSLKKTVIALWSASNTKEPFWTRISALLHKLKIRDHC